jgi:hypothetical protein
MTNSRNCSKVWPLALLARLADDGPVAPWRAGSLVVSSCWNGSSCWLSSSGVELAVPVSVDDGAGYGAGCVGVATVAPPDVQAASSNAVASAKSMA